MKLAHARAVALAVPSWVIAFAWLWPRAVRAAAESPLSADVIAFDWISLAYAAGLGLLGGVLALIVALATDQRVVTEVVKEGSRNAVVSPIAGAGAYAALKGVVALGGPVLTVEPRFLVIVAAGYAGIAFIQSARDLAGKGAAGFGDWLANLLNRGK